MNSPQSVPDQTALEALAAEVGALLGANGQKLATAESCTGGWVAQCLTAIAGSSDWFERGFTPYTNEARRETRGAARETPDGQGAVRVATAQAMAQGALRRSRADWSVAITGIAGPTGGSPDKPVGTVCFGWAGPDGFTTTELCHPAGSRAEVRAQSVAYALHGVLQHAAILRA